MGLGWGPKGSWLLQDLFPSATQPHINIHSSYQAVCWDWENGCQNPIPSNQPSYMAGTSKQGASFLQECMLFILTCAWRKKQNWKIEKKCSFIVKLEILLPPLSISPRWNLLHFYNTTHQKTETAHHITHHATVASLDATKEHVWVDCQFVISRSWKIWLWGEISRKSPSPQPVYRALTVHPSVRSTNYIAGIRRWPEDTSQPSPIHPSHMGLHKSFLDVLLGSVEPVR